MRWWRPARAAAGGAAAFDALRAQLGEMMLDEVIKKDMECLRVAVDKIHFFSEASLHASGSVETAVQALRERGELREEDGALWFNASAYGDEKDRVLRRANGELTYFAADIAYHRDKLGRGASAGAFLHFAECAGRRPPRLCAAPAGGDSGAGAPRRCAANGDYPVCRAV